MHEDHETDAPLRDEPSPAPPQAGSPFARASGPQPAPLPSRETPTWEIAVWAVLAIVVLAIFALTLLAPAAEPPDDPAGRLEYRFQARYALGVETAFSKLGEGFVQDLDNRLLEQLRTLAATPAERLCLVPLVAELDGPEQALAEIASVRRTAGEPAAGEPAAGEPAAGEPVADIETDLALLESLYRGAADEITDAERESFRARRGWFAGLALSWGKDPQDPERRAILADAMGVAALMIALVTGVAGAALAGLVLLGVAIVQLRRGKLRFAYRSAAGAAGAGGRVPFLETVVVFIVAMIAASLAAGLVLEWSGSKAVSLAASMLALPALLWPLLRGVPSEDLRHAYGWQRGRGLWREVGWGLVGYVAGAPLLVLAILVSLLLATWIGETPHHPLMDGIVEAGWGGILVIYLVACVSAPVMEETVFRGAFYHYLRGRLGVPASALVVSAVFALIHPQGVLGLPPLIALAMILAILREWRGSLIAPIAVHALHNGLATTVIVLMLS